MISSHNRRRTAGRGGADGRRRPAYPRTKCAGDLDGAPRPPPARIAGPGGVGGRAAPRAAADYHVSSAGDDAGSGTAAAPWRSIDRVNRGAYGPGDRIRFEGGAEFAGNLVLAAPGSRTEPAKPITVGSYGRGRATICGGRGTAVRVEDLGGVVIRDLVVVGDRRGANEGFGILVLHRRADATPLKGIRVDDVEARGFRWAGIYIGGLPTGLPVFSDQKAGRHGCTDVQIRRCLARENMYFGIYVDGAGKEQAADYANRDVAIIDCTAADNPGDPHYTANHSGNGILLADTDGGLIDRCVAYGNGAANAGQSGGPVGIWTYASNRVTIQSCESFGNRTGGQADGGGFDLDGGVTHSEVQYCYSHDNDGAGFLVWNYEGAPHSLADNVVRYNISAGDGRKHRYGGISVGTSDEPVHDLVVHNNTVYAARIPGGEPSCVRIWERSGDGLRFVNNLFVTAGGVPAVLCEAKGDGVRFAGNAYWAVEGRLEIRDGALLKNLVEWRGHGPGGAGEARTWDSRPTRGCVASRRRAPTERSGSGPIPVRSGFGPGLLSSMPASTSTGPRQKATAAEISGARPSPRGRGSTSGPTSMSRRRSDLVLRASRSASRHRGEGMPGRGLTSPRCIVLPNPVPLPPRGGTEHLLQGPTKPLEGRLGSRQAG